MIFAAYNPFTPRKNNNYPETQKQPQRDIAPETFVYKEIRTNQHSDKSCN